MRVEGVEVEEAVADSSSRDNIHEINNSDKIKHDIFSNNTRLFSVLLAISTASNQFRRMREMRVGAAAVWLAAEEVQCTFVSYFCFE